MATADITPDLPTASSWKLGDGFSDGFGRLPAGDNQDGFTAADVFVAVAITLVSVALTLALIVQTPIPVTAAVAGAGAVWLAMIVGHAALRRAERRKDSQWDEDWDEENFGESDDVEPDFVQRDRRPDAAARDRRMAEAAVSRPVADPEPGEPFGRRGPQPVKRVARKRPDGPAAKPGEAPANVALKDLDLGDFRPKAAAEREPDGGRSALGELRMADEEQNVDAMLRRLADDITRGRKTAPKVVPEAKQPNATVPEPAAPAAQRTAPGGQPAAAAADQQAPVPGKVMPPPLPPSFPPKAGETVAQPAGPVPYAQQTAAGRLAAIADALSDEQMDVFLETINGLEDYRARHYEVSVRLRLDGGVSLDHAEMISQTRGSGLLPLIEAVKVSSTKRVAVQMIQRGRAGDFFSLVDGEALHTPQFGEDMETIIGADQALAARLVLAFSQDDLRGFTTAQWESLREIAALGFRFSIEDIADLDMDFEKLASHGFAFAKLDARVFLEGLPIENSRVPAADICRHLSGAGLALIVGGIADETLRAKILGFGALLGQGTLFGAPRPVRSDVLRQRETPHSTAG